MHRPQRDAGNEMYSSKHKRQQAVILLLSNYPDKQSRNNVGTADKQNVVGLPNNSGSHAIKTTLFSKLN